MIEGTRSVLEELGLVIEKFSSLGDEQPTIAAKTQKAWKKLRWDADAVKDFRSRIISNTMILDVFNSSLTSRASETMIEDLATLDDRVRSLQLKGDQHERIALLDWITPLTFPAQQNAVFSRRQEGTGQWLFESPEFKQWIKKPRETLLCRGIPGAGKTTLASIAIDHLQGTLRHEDIPVVYIYCDYRKQEEQTPINLMASILRQLLQHRTSVPDIVTKSYHHHVSSETRPDIGETVNMLKILLAEFAQTYVVVDALDELSASGGQVRKDLLTNLRSLQKFHNLNCMMTSRSNPQIDHQLQGSLFLEIRASNEDIKKYVYGNMGDLTKSAQNNPKLQEVIANSIVDVVDGMFLLAQLHMDSLTDKTSPKAIRKALERLPIGSGALDLAYDQAMNRIADQKPGFIELAERALSWITYACRLLTVTELRHAMATEVGESEFDEENLGDIEEILSVCCGLVIIDTETKVVRLVHYTTQEYFKKTGSRHFPNAREDIAVSILTYLLFSDFEEGWIRDESEGLHVKDNKSVSVAEARLKKYPFLEYAALFWARHASNSTAWIARFEDRVGKLLIEFLTDDYKVSSVGQILSHGNHITICPVSDVLSPTPISGMHLATHFNLYNLMYRLLETGLFAADVKDEAGRTPLFWAARQGHIYIVLMHRRDGMNPIPNIIGIDDFGETSMGGSELALKVLLEHQDMVVGQLGSHGHTLQDWKNLVRHTGIVQLLLDRDDVDADHKDDDGTTPLAIAVSEGQSEVVGLLLEREDVDVKSKDNYGRTVLELASERAESDAGSQRRQKILSLIRSAVEARSEIFEESLFHGKRELFRL